MTIAELRRSYHDGAAEPGRCPARRLPAHPRRRRTSDLDLRWPTSGARSSGRAPSISRCLWAACLLRSRTASTSQGCTTTRRLPRFSPTRATGDGARGSAPAGRRRHSRRQDEPRSVRHGTRRRAFTVRRLRQCVRSALHRRRVELRIGDRRLPPACVPSRSGTDTAGSGRVPAAFNNLVGVKPTRGLLSTTGLVPACRSLDCMSVLAVTAEDGELVWRLAQGSGQQQRLFAHVHAGRRRRALAARTVSTSACRIGRSSSSSATTSAAALFAEAIARLEAVGGIRVTIDFAPVPRRLRPALRGYLGGRTVRRARRLHRRATRTR